MDLIKRSVEHVLFVPSREVSITLLVVLAVIIPLWRFLLDPKHDLQPPRLRETIPYVSNIWLYMTNKKEFLRKISQLIKRAPVVECQLGPAKVYFITGTGNVSKLFKHSSTSLVSEPWMLTILENVAGYTSTDMKKLARDKSGINKAPNPNTQPINPEDRIWHAKHNVHNEYLGSPRHVAALAASFEHHFSTGLEAYRKGSWAEVSILKFMREAIASAAVCSIVGRSIVDMNPGFIDKLWEYDSYAESLAFGLPSVLNKRGLQVRKDFREMCLKWYRESSRETDWDVIEPDDEGSSSDELGSRFSKELARWGKSFDFSDESMAGVYAFLFLGLNTNTIPVCTWAVMEIIKDPELFRAIRDEVLSVSTPDPVSGRQVINVQRLTSLPIIQSVYAESLRLHLSLNITRTLIEEMSIAGFTLPKGCTVQAPSEISHTEEAVWGAPGHPASEFWAYRHVKPSIGANDIYSFSLAGSAGSFFPYGGGAYICPGRSFAKQEILLVIALIVSRFDVEFIKWTKLDGSPSDRPAQNDPRYACAGSVPPDREMIVRWRRIY